MKIPLRSKAAAPSLKAIKRLKKHGFEGYWVGGSVRDIALGLKPKDYDVVTNALPREIAKLFPKHLKIGKKFGIIITTEFEIPVEIATFRKDLSYKDGRRPSGIKPASLSVDVLRRDFTVNGLLVDPYEGRVVDKVRGLSDLKKRTLRAIGEPEKRFREDHLRMLRAIRFSVQLNFKIEVKTWKAIQKHAGKIKKISPERIREELLKILSSPRPGKGLELLSDSGLLKVILPEVERMKGVTQSKTHHPEGDVFVHTCRVVECVKEKTPAVLWAALFHDVEKPSCKTRDEAGIHFYGHEIKGEKTARKILKRFKVSNADIEAVSFMVRRHLTWYGARQMRPTRLRYKLEQPYSQMALELLRADSLGSDGNLDSYRYIMRKKRQFEKEEPKLALLTGADLLKLGIKEGPIIGEILSKVEEMRLNEEISTTIDAKKWVQKRYLDG